MDANVVITYVTSDANHILLSFGFENAVFYSKDNFVVAVDVGGTVGTLTALCNDVSVTDAPYEDGNSVTPTSTSPVNTLVFNVVCVPTATQTETLGADSITYGIYFSGAAGSFHPQCGMNINAT